MKKKDEVAKFSEEVKGKSVPANEITETTGQKKISFKQKGMGVPDTPESVKPKKKMVRKTDKSTDRTHSPDHKFLGINYYEYHIDELHQRAREMDIDGRSKMNKEDLIEALYENHTQEEIYEMASKADIPGRSKMSKTQLINELRNRTDNTPNTKQKNSSNRTSSNSKSGTSTTGSTKNSSVRDYYKMTKEELYEEAQKKDIDGRSKMDKDDLLEALYEDQTREDLYEKAKKEDIKGRSRMNKKQLIKELQTA